MKFLALAEQLCIRTPLIKLCAAEEEKLNSGHALFHHNGYRGFGYFFFWKKNSLLSNRSFPFNAFFLAGNLPKNVPTLNQAGSYFLKILVPIIYILYVYVKTWIQFYLFLLVCHSSQFQSLCSTKRSSEMLQNLPYFIYTKSQSYFFHFSFRATLFFPLMNAPVYVEIDQGIH